MEATEPSNPWVWAFSQKHQQRYWYNSATQESSWIDPFVLAKRRHGDQQQLTSTGKRYRVARVLAALEDHPSLSIERDKLLGDALDVLAKENAKFGEMGGETKTAKSCRKDGMKVGMQGVFARIIWFELLQQIQELGDVGTMVTDSIFPNSFRGDPAVLKEFIDADRSEAEGKMIMDVVGVSLTVAARRLLDMKRDIIARPVITKVVLTTVGSGGRAKCSIDFQGVKYSISPTHLDKLLRLYNLHTDEFAHTNDSLFLRRVFCVLARYETLSGKSDGYQMAFPDVGFQFLRDRHHVSTECFASPLNCWNERFCSIARDTDQFFGSLGNFFSFDGKTGIHITEDTVEGGSFEANPPFVEAVMNDMATRIFELLEKYPNAPFSVIVIVPAWADCKGVIEMTNSRFTRPHIGYRLVLEKKKHDYRPGMQHRTGHSHQSSNVDTFVFYLQNDAGAAKWPVQLRDAEDLQALLETDCRTGNK